MNDEKIQGRLDFAKGLTREAGAKAKVYFLSIGDLVIQQKGAQDLVSNADLAVETFIRNRLAESYPDDGIVGEEHDNLDGTFGYTWVIDPIDGTDNFLTATAASGRLIGYAESHMSAWDCLAEQLLIAEAGGCVEAQSADDMLVNGGRVIASGPGVFDKLPEMANEVYTS